MRGQEEIVVEELLDGLRLVYTRRAGARAGILGVAVRAGSANDGPGREGLAHFVEHTIFKGTQRRSSWHIINRMEAVGGELNAYTTKEETVVYTIFPSGEAARGAELVADLIVNSRFPEKELSKEREVVADEIDSYLDTPSEAVFDDFEDLMFEGTPVGHNILGSKESLRGFTPEICREYLRSNYVRSNMVVFYSGSRPLAAIRKLVERYFGEVPPGTVSAPAWNESREIPAKFDIHKIIDSHQAHTVLGTRVPGIYSSDRYAVALLANILGGPGMNSKLNVELRERRGLVYSVEASTAMFAEGGALCVYYGCDPEDAPTCRKLCADVFATIRDKGLSGRQLDAAKKQYTGQLLLAGENSENRILAAARAVLFRGHAATHEETSTAIQAIQSADLQALASHLADSCSSLTLGPV
ncbi:MAG: insulinase family protein [Muribaculaceae bacterium]|nr:insulinase family protein [Muribaculaceae bacterium]